MAKNKPITSNLRSLVTKPEDLAFAGAVQDAVDGVAKQVSDLGEPFRNSGILIDPSRLDPNPLAKTVYPVAPSQVISLATNRISPGSTFIRLSNTTGGHITLTSTPTIANGLPQQYVVLYNIGTKNIILQDQGTLAGSNLQLGANTRTLAPRQSIALLYSNDIGDWVEQYYSADFNLTARAITLSDVATTNGSPNITSASASWTSANIGDYIAIESAGTGGNPLIGVIISASGTTATISVNAQSTLSGLNAVYGVDDTTNLNTALALASSASGCLDLLGKSYLVTELLIPSNVTMVNGTLYMKPGNVRLKSPVTIDGYTAPKSNITLRNVHVNGLRWGQYGMATVPSEEDGGNHGFRLLGYCSDIVIEDCSAHYCATDGFIAYSKGVSTSDAPDSLSFQRVRLRNFRATYNRRHGASGDSWRDMDWQGVYVDYNGLTLDGETNISRGNRGAPDGAGNLYAGGLWWEDNNSTVAGGGIDGFSWIGGSARQNHAFGIRFYTHTRRVIPPGPTTTTNYETRKKIRIVDVDRDYGQSSAYDYMAIQFQTDEANRGFFGNPSDALFEDIVIVGGVQDGNYGASVTDGLTIIGSPQTTPDANFYGSVVRCSNVSLIGTGSGDKLLAGDALTVTGTSGSRPRIFIASSPGETIGQDAPAGGNTTIYPTGFLVKNASTRRYGDFQGLVQVAVTGDPVAWRAYGAIHDFFSIGSTGTSTVALQWQRHRNVITSAYLNTNITGTLPDPALCTGIVYDFYRPWDDSSAYTCTLTPYAAETISGKSAFGLRPGQHVSLLCDGINWFIVAGAEWPGFVGVTDNYTVKANDKRLIVFMGGAGKVVTLPLASAVPFMEVFMKNLPGFPSFDVQPTAPDTIDGSGAAVTITAGTRYRVWNDSANWYNVT